MTWAQAIPGAVIAVVFLLLSGCATQESQDFEIRDDANEVSVAVLHAGQELFRYQFGERWALPHLYPLRSPSGRSMTVQRTEPYPHHRSLWIADRIALLPKGRQVDFYHEWKNLIDKKHPDRGHKSRIQHVRFLQKRVTGGPSGGGRAILESELLWMVTPEQPALRERRRFVVRSLGDGEYLLDLSWSLHADFGDVRFHSDWVHYAWPYVRMNTAFNGEHGGVIEDSQGRRGQKATNGQCARWVDYSGGIDGRTEGLAIFLPKGQPKSRWLTREYGCFGPRRPDAFSGTNFILKKGETLEGHVGILVHKGDVRGGHVSSRYQDWIRGGS